MHARKKPAIKNIGPAPTFVAAKYHSLEEQHQENIFQTKFHRAKVAIYITLALDYLAVASPLNCYVVE